MKFHSLIILTIIAISLFGAFYINRFLQKIIQPRKSFGQFIIYLISAFVIVFAYTFLLVWVVVHLFPVTNK
ncbi:MAG TPA: hypothetical protein VHZ50_19175 [Puia sp.]|nr:hypothetical protein [Puia sp.]